jgi:hypothetical protein
MSNKPYSYKKAYYINSGISLNRTLPDEFKEKDILDRAEKISKLACERWKFPTTTLN